LADHSTEAIQYHTATHLLHQALRDTLGQHVLQKGSNITRHRLRFDFSHPSQLTPEEIEKVEKLVNKKIQEGLPVKREEMTVQQAKQEGALGLFEQKYGEKVSVYSIGDFSKEICGGPHVANTGLLGSFKITKQESAGAGVRRIKAVLE
jgi:alanyl-tRNA synthetase